MTINCLFFIERRKDMIYEDSHVKNYNLLEDLGKICPPSSADLMEILTFGLIDPIKAFVDSYIAEIDRYLKDLKFNFGYEVKYEKKKEI